VRRVHPVGAVSDDHVAATGRSRRYRLGSAIQAPRACTPAGLLGLVHRKEAVVISIERKDLKLGIWLTLLSAVVVAVVYAILAGMHD